MEITRLSSKGQIVLPKKIRSSHAWEAGTEFIVEETSEGILLRPAKRVPSTSLDMVAGCLRSKRRLRSRAQLRAAIADEVLARHDRGRY